MSIHLSARTYIINFLCIILLVQQNFYGGKVCHIAANTSLDKTSSVITSSSSIQFDSWAFNNTLLAQHFPFELSNLSLAVEDTESYKTLVLSVDHGSLAPIMSKPGVWVRQFGQGAENLISGRTRLINEYLNEGHVKYLPPYFDWEGMANVHFEMVEGVVEKKESFVAIADATMSILVRPELIMSHSLEPKSVSIWEDENLYFSMHPIVLSFTGVSSRTYELECSVNATRGIVSTSLLYGSVSNVTTHFSEITYTPPANYNGMDRVYIKCHNALLLQESECFFTIGIQAVNDAPRLVTPKRHFETYEDQVIYFGTEIGSYILDSDSHEYVFSTVAITVTVSTDCSTMIIPVNFSFAPDEFIGGVYTTISSSALPSILILGAVSHVNHALQLLQFKFLDNWFGRGEVTMKCSEILDYSVLPTDVDIIPVDESCSDSVTFQVVSVNDKPEITVKDPKMFIQLEDAVVSFADGAILVRDVDAAANERYRLFISVAKSQEVNTGKLILNSSPPSDVEILSDTVDPICSADNKMPSSILGFEGSLAAISLSVEKVRWVSEQHWYGVKSDGVCISVYDDQKRSSSVSMVLHLLPTPDRPTFFATIMFATNDEDNVFILGDKFNVSVIDPDSDHSPAREQHAYEVKISSYFGGVLSFSKHVSGCYIMEGQSGNTTTIRFKGIRDVINEALVFMQYSPPKDFDQIDFLDIRVEDNSGLVDDLQLKINMKSVNDSPEVKGLDTIYEVLDEGSVVLRFNNLSIVDVDSEVTDLITVNVRVPVELNVLDFSLLKDSVEVNLDEGLALNNYDDGIVRKSRLCTYETRPREVTVTCPLGEIARVMRSSSIRLELSDFELYETSWTMTFEATDKYGAITTTSISVPRPHRWNIFPTLNATSMLIQSHEDMEIKLGSHVTIGVSSNFDSLFELAILSRTIVLFDDVEISISLAECGLCGGLIYFEIVFSNDKTTALSIDTTASDLKEALESIKIVSAAKVLRREHDSAHSVSFHLQLLTFEDSSLDINIVKMYQQKNDSIPSKIHKSLESEEASYRCNPKPKVKRQRILDPEQRLIQNWGLPSIIGNGTLKVANVHLRRLYLMAVENNYELEVSGESIVMRGAISDIEAALAQVVFVPPLNFYGRSRIDFVLKHVHNLYSSSIFEKHVSASIFVAVSAVDDEPMIFWKNCTFLDHEVVLEMDENSIETIGEAISLFDVDISSEPIFFSTHAIFGHLCIIQSLMEEVNNDSSLATEESKDCSTLGDHLHINGTLREINEIILNLFYEPAPNWSGIDEITLEVKSGELSTKNRIPVHVFAVSKCPNLEIKEPSTLRTPEDSLLQINGLTIQQLRDDSSMHVDDRIVQLHFSARHGELRILEDGLYYLHAANTSNFNLYGYIHSLNSAIQTVIYEPFRNFFGQDIIYIELEEDSKKCNEITLQVEVESVRDAPRVIFPPSEHGHVFRINEDVATTVAYDEIMDSCSGRCRFIQKGLPCCGLQLRSLDGVKNESFILHLKADNGLVQIPRLRVRTSEIQVVEGSNETFSPHLVLKGPIDALNDVLIGALFKPSVDFTSRDGKLARLHVTIANESALSSRLTILFEVLPVNDHPDITADFLQTNRNATDLVFTSGAMYDYDHNNYTDVVLTTPEDRRLPVVGVAVNDVDCTRMSDFLEVMVVTTNGTLIFERGFGVYEWIVGKIGQAHKEVSFRGSLPYINEALQYFYYVPDPDFHGYDQLTIMVSDEGNVGIDLKTGGSVNLNTSISIPIFVTPVLDHPVISVQANTSTLEETPVTVTAKIFHGDSDATKVRVSISCNHGIIHIRVTEGIAFLNETKTRSSYISGAATVKIWNKALKDLQYIPDVHWNSHNNIWDRITWKICNAQNCTLQMMTEKVTVIRVDPVNDSPVWIIPGRHLILRPIGGYEVSSVDTLYVNEDEILLVTPVSIEDPDRLVDDFLITVVLSARFGSIKLARLDGLFFLDGNNGRNHMKFRGSSLNCNNALNQIEYQPNRDFHGSDSILFQVFDEGNIGIGGEKSSNITLPILVKPIIDTPTIRTPFFVSCTQEARCSVSGIHLDDPDNNDRVFIEISCGECILSFANTRHLASENLQIIAGSDASASSAGSEESDFYRIIGDAKSINRLFQVVWYLPKGVSDQARLDFIHLVVWSLPTGDEATRSTSTSKINVVLVGKDGYWDLS